MQCEGITRSGRRCRNKALEDGIFCDIHLRVNQTYSLTLLVPLLTVLLLGYFFLYGIFFDTLVYGVFDLNYLKFAGLADFFTSMMRVGGMLTVVVLKLWLAFTFAVALCFAIALLVKVTVLTSRLHLKLGRRIRIIGLSLGIYVLNFLHLFVVLMPRLNRRQPAQLLVGREHLARSLRAEKQRTHQSFPRNARRSVALFFRRFLFISTFGNHRFFATILALVVTSAVTVLYAGHQAREVRGCVIDAAENQPVTTAKPSGLPGLNITTLCSDGPVPVPQNVSIAGKFSDSLSSFFSYPAIVLSAGTEQIPLAYIGSTDRFELFFSGVTRLPFILPNRNLGAMFDRPSPEVVQLSADIQEELSSLASQSRSTEAALAAVATLTGTENLQKQKIDSLEREMQELLATERQRIIASIPADCWAIPPIALLEFKSGSADTSQTAKQELFVALSRRFQEIGSRRIVISGFTDPSGPPGLNMELSVERAEAVRDILVVFGLDPKFVTAIGHGEDSDPRYPQRRVEIRDCTEIF